RYAANEQEVFLGHSVTQRQNMSGETAKLVDQEVRRIVTDGEKKAREVLTEHKADLMLLSDTLVEYETLSGEEVMAVLRGEKLSRPVDAPVPPSAPTPALPITEDEDATPAPHPGGWGGAAPQGA
ncbi:MAG TPA: hypothetical protein VFO00_12825, partial [Vitreimonas sp.]|nr:hypothetical protein [Vitreimonas sp.]